MSIVKLFLLKILISFLCIKGEVWAEGQCNIPEESAFPCDYGGCIRMTYWCDRDKDCIGGSDEKHCPFSFEDCGTDKFECKTDAMCIPKKGHCDGFISCPDGSDEEDCPCEDLQEAKGSISRNFLVGQHRSYHRCWKFDLEEHEQLTVTVEGSLYSRICDYGNITFFIEKGIFFIEKEETQAYNHTICSAELDSGYVRNFTFNSDVKIEYVSFFTSEATENDEFNITYSKSCSPLLPRNGSEEKKIQIGWHRTSYQCWNFVLNENEQITINIEGKLYLRECKFGNITLSTDGSYFFEGDVKIESSFYTICPVDMNNKTFTFVNDVKIHFTSYFPFEGDALDVFKFTYSKSFAALTQEFFENTRKNVTRWMRSQRDADWGWKENTARAVIALYLSNDLNFSTISHEDDLEAKQLELEVSTFLLRNTIEKASVSEMATYINALQAICHNPRNFYGIDLVQKLKKEIQENSNNVSPFPYLTLCIAKETVSEGVIDSLVQILYKQSDFGFALEIQALVSMALSCISNKDPYKYLKQNLTNHLNKIKKEQKEDGSFGNEYTTALVIQALIANNQANDRDWGFKAAAEYLKKMQKPDGSFGDFLTTYLMMPALNGKSLVDLRTVNCTDSLKRPREGNPVSDIKNRLGGKIPVKYSLIIGDEKDQVLPIFLRTPENITVLELMTLAADIDPKYKFKTHRMKEKTYVYEISSIPNDPEKNKFWFLYQQVGNDTELTSKQSPDEVYVGENCQIIMWYRTLIQWYDHDQISVGDI